MMRNQGGNYATIVYIEGVFEPAKRLAKTANNKRFAEQYHKLESTSTLEKNETFIMDGRSRIASIRVGDSFPNDIDAEYYVLEDHLGSGMLRLKATAGGSVLDREEYYPFGDSSLRTWTKKRYQYVGKEKDAESGLYYYGARYYSPWTCRFISVDPLAAKYAHLNPYNNAGNKVINQKDIDGLQGENENTSEGSGPTPSSELGSIQKPSSNVEIDVNLLPKVEMSSLQEPPDNLRGLSALFIEEEPVAEPELDKLLWHPPLAAIEKKPQEFVVDPTFDAFIEVMSKLAGFSERNPNYNVDKAVQKLNERALANSVHECAKYVRIAINSGGVKTPDNPVSAKDYKGYLDKLDFNRVNQEFYEPKKGDIVVFQPAKGGSKHGHIQIYNGEQWVSDFKQNDFWPGSDYSKSKPEYTIYR